MSSLIPVSDVSGITGSFTDHILHHSTSLTVHPTTSAWRLWRCLLSYVAGIENLPVSSAAVYSASAVCWEWQDAHPWLYCQLCN